MRFLTAIFLLLSSSFLLFSQTVYHVSPSGSNRNDGSAPAPMKNIETALAKAKAGDSVLVSQGLYQGKFGAANLKISQGITLKGGYSPDFSQWDPWTYLTLFAPDNPRGGENNRAFVEVSGRVDGLTIQGFVFDSGDRNAYKTNGDGALLLPPSRPPQGNITVTKSILTFAAGTQGKITIRDNVFLNAPHFAIQGGLRDGVMRIENNLIVNSRMGGIEVYGTSAQPAGKIEIVNNTVLLNWARTPGLTDLGYGVRIMTNTSYLIEKNVIGFSSAAGISHNRFLDNTNITVNSNVLFANRRGDLEYSPESNLTLFLSVPEWEDVDWNGDYQDQGGWSGDFQGFGNAAYAFIFWNSLDETDLEAQIPAIWPMEPGTGAYAPKVSRDLAASLWGAFGQAGARVLP
jgi:hypothetical protein